MNTAQIGWQPIATYDELKTKPKRAAFRFAPVEKGRLSETVQLTRTFGIRVCTHWYALPDTGDL